MHWGTSVIFLFVGLGAAAQSGYYGRNFDKLLRDKSSTGPQLKSELYKALSLYHVKNGAFDEIVEKCEINRRCIRHKSLGYKGARKVLFGKIHLIKGNQIFDVYCDRLVSDRSIGPGRIPNSRLLNTEHTWPQSKFSKSFAKSLQKSDMHALYPVNPRVNSQRSNLKFGIVDIQSRSICSSSKRGSSRKYSGTFFEPPDAHKGNAARAIFYFAVRYKMRVRPDQEAFLRQWHLDDPIDQFEIDRNNAIYAAQKNRNPFVDFPKLVSRIHDF